jgi:Resolvase, N terminal domain
VLPGPARFASGDPHLAAVAEHEREVISKRTKAALAAAKARGNEVGHPEADARGPYGECGTVCGQRPADHSRD